MAAARRPLLLPPSLLLLAAAAPPAVGGLPGLRPARLGASALLGDLRSAAHHLAAGPLWRSARVSDVANVRIPRADGGVIHAFEARPPAGASVGGGPTPILIVVHEFFGLNAPIAEKARALSDELGCIALAPDTFRGVATDFVPRAIWLALSTPQERVNADLADAVAYARAQRGASADSRVAVLGFCYGGGKALRYCAGQQPDAAPVVLYGSPLTDVAALRRLRAPLCALYGARDPQFPPFVLDAFREALARAGVAATLRVYPRAGHAFWASMAQVRAGQEPQASAWRACVAFLADFYGGNGGTAARGSSAPAR